MATRYTIETFPCSWSILQTQRAIYRMRPATLSASGQALYRVFICSPSAVRTSSVCAQQCLKNKLLASTSVIQARSAFTHPKSKVTVSPLTADPTRPLDEAIKARTILYIDESGVKHPGASLAQTLSSFDRTTHHLRQVGTGQEGEPVCKLISKKALWAERQAKAKPKKDVKDMAKQIELNWAIDANDLEHRLDKMEEFLREGRRVEVLLAPKKRGRKASVDEQEDVLNKIRDRAEAIEGAEEWKDMEGKPPGQTVLHFRAEAEGVKKTAVADKLDKFDKKEQEKRERREKQEKRLARKQEQDKAREAAKTALSSDI